MDSLNPLSRLYPGVAAFLTALCIIFNIVGAISPFVPYLYPDKEPVHIQQLPASYSSKGVIAIKILSILEKPQVFLKGFNCIVDSVSINNSYGQEVSATLKDNIIQINSVIEGSLTIHYVLKNPSRIENVIVTDGKRSWSLISQREEEQRQRRLSFVINVVLIFLISICILLYIGDLHTRIRNLSAGNMPLRAPMT